jgi:peroxiredoxin
MAERHALAFPVLSDVGNPVARTYGLVFQYDAPTKAFFNEHGLDLAQYNGDASWELPVPATFIIAPDGTVRYAFIDPDFRNRLDPADLLAQVRAIASAAPATSDAPSTTNP